MVLSSGQYTVYVISMRQRSGVPETMSICLSRVSPVYCCEVYRCPGGYRCGAVSSVKEELAWLLYSECRFSRNLSILRVFQGTRTTNTPRVEMPQDYELDN